eukprot:m.308670 g.308670  ORF g.308670 m.308670 type:complete len:100 (+) comp44474_c0_seq1:236-535(+)
MLCSLEPMQPEDGGLSLTISRDGKIQLWDGHLVLIQFPTFIWILTPKKKQFILQRKTVGCMKWTKLMHQHQSENPMGPTFLGIREQEYQRNDLLIERLD